MMKHLFSFSFICFFNMLSGMGYLKVVTGAISCEENSARVEAQSCYIQADGGNLRNLLIHNEAIFSIADTLNLSDSQVGALVVLRGKVFLRNVDILSEIIVEKDADINVSAQIKQIPSDWRDENGRVVLKIVKKCQNLE